MLSSRPPILKRLRTRMAQARTQVRELRNVARAALRSSTGADAENFALSAEIPGALAGKPLWRMRVEMVTEPQGTGERLRLRAHFQAHLASNLAPALAALPAGHPSETPSLPAERVRAAVRAGFAHPLVRRIAEPLMRHDFNSWLELQASTAELDAGAGALLPQHERLAALGVELPAGDGPLAQTWAGESRGATHGYAQLSLLRMDKRHLPETLARMLGRSPFSLAAAVVNVAEQPPEAPGE